MRSFVAENNITDILFANNIFNACSPKIAARYSRFLTQSESSLPATAKVVEAKKYNVAGNDSIAAHYGEEKNMKPKSENSSSEVEADENIPVSPSSAEEG